MFTLALGRARELDSYQQRTGNIIGPLHGLPVSVKDTFHIKDVDSSIGIAALAFKPATENAPLVDILLAAGAVIHCKTNVPQTLLALDSVNNVFGRTLNPLNRTDWTVGGSSGGEGALVAMRGSVFGIGTDVGGSIRIPAMCNAVLGFKPSSGRISSRGQTTGQLDAAGKVGLEASVGPIARNLDDIGLFLETVEGAKMWERDSDVVPGTWWNGLSLELSRPKTGKAPLIGILWTDGVTTPLPPVTKMLQSLVSTLRSRGVSTTDIDPAAFDKCQSLANKFFGVEGGNHILDTVGSTGEPLIPWLAPRLRRKAPRSINEFRELMARKIGLQDEMLKIWRDDRGRNVDVIVCPVAPHPVPPIDRWNAIGYTSSFVLLDYPAGVVQVTQVEPSDLEAEAEGEAKNPWDKANRELWDKREMDRKVYLGSPLAVQVVAPRLQERRCWEGMKIVHEAVHGSRSLEAKL